MRAAVSSCASCGSALRAVLRNGDPTGADDPVQKLVEVGGEFLRGIAGPDVQRLRGTLGLLQRGALGQLRGEHERSEHVAKLLDAELVLDGLRAYAVHDDAEGLEPGRESPTDLLDGAEGAVGGGDGEQSGFRDHHDAVAGGPGGAGERVQGGSTVDEDEVVVGLDRGERLLELPHVTHARVRPVEVDRGGAPDQHIDGAGVDLRPSARGDRLSDDLLLRVRQDVGDVEPTCHLDVHPGGDVGLRVEVDDESPDAPSESRGGQPECHGRLADAPLERADAEYVHGHHVTFP